MASRITSTTGMNVGKQSYSLYIPNGWTTDHRTAYGVDYYFLFAPKTQDDPNTSINVITEDMEHLTLNEFRELTISSVMKNMPNASMLTQGDITANGLKGNWYSYIMEPEGIKATLVGYIFPKDGVAYLITAGTQMKDAERYRPLFDSVAMSFRFTELVPNK